MTRIFHRIAGAAVAAILAAFALAPISGAALAPYTQDFEGMTPNQGWPPNDLSADGWKVFGIVWDANHYLGPANQVYAYGPFDAANGAPGSMQGVASGEGGPDQGRMSLNKYSDYNNPDQTTRYIQALTYRPATIGADDVGPWRFIYDAKLGNLTPDSSAFAYMQVVDSVTFFQKRVAINDSTNLPTVWGTYSLDIVIDPDMVGDTLSIGFSATATNYTGSAVFYDNLRFGRPDTDADGVDDLSDNCILVANAGQIDTDSDGFGNLCDADLNNDCITNVVDLGIFKSVFFSADPDADFNADGVVNVLDLGIMKAGFFVPPGPSAAPNICDATRG